MRIGVEIKAKIVYHFRILQRCRLEAQWADAMATFFQNVEHAIMNQRTAPKNSERAPEPSPEDTARYREQYDFVRNYFMSNWFTDEWRG